MVEICCNEANISTVSEYYVLSFSSLLIFVQLGFVLYFASGGAGIILSHISVKMFLVSLAYLDDAVLSAIITILQDDSSLTLHCDHVSEINHVYQVEHRSNILCSIKFILQFISHLSDQAFKDASVQIHLSTVGDQQALRFTISRDLKTKELLLEVKNSVATISSHTRSDLLEACSATTDWDAINPALVMAYCLQKSYQVQPLEVSVIDGNLSNQTVYERLNCFGIVRTLYGDVDDWYTLAKLPYTANKVKANSLLNQQPISIARDVISFHYVSELEASLLYRILSKEVSVSSKEELIKVWPKNDKEAGPYARWRFHNDEEVANLFHHLTQYITVKSC
jgi:hypothetical protein